MAKQLLNKGFKNVFIVMEGLDKRGAEDAMMKAGFPWYWYGKVVQFDKNGLMVNKSSTR